MTVSFVNRIKCFLSMRKALQICSHFVRHIVVEPLWMSWINAMNSLIRILCFFKYLDLVLFFWKRINFFLFWYIIFYCGFYVYWLKLRTILEKKSGKGSFVFFVLNLFYFILKHENKWFEKKYGFFQDSLWFQAEILTLLPFFCEKGLFLIFCFFWKSFKIAMNFLWHENKA